MNKAWLWGMAFLSWSLLMLWLSLTPAPPRIRLPFLSWDKVQHFSAYTLLTILAANSCRYLKPLARRNWWFAAGFAMLFGIGVEFLQYHLHRGRMADIQDIAANGLGILTACLLAWCWRWVRGSRSRP